MNTEQGTRYCNGSWDLYSTMNVPDETSQGHTRAQAAVAEEVRDNEDTPVIEEDNSNKKATKKVGTSSF